jgi:exodeoxyribonuclease V alpha subunit
VQIIAALTSASLNIHQHIYLNLYNINKYLETTEIDLPSTEDIVKELLSSNVVGKYPENKPLLYENGKVYINKYYQYELGTAKLLIECFNSEFQEDNNNEKFLDVLFGIEQNNMQRKAAEIALKNKFTILTGGPGTGKTTTVAKILLLLLYKNNDLSIGICAPTGKAAARLQTSLEEFLIKNSYLFELEIFKNLKDKFPTKAYTIHTLLKSKFPSPTFHYNKNNPLNFDLIVVDETSMISLPLFYKLLSSIQKDTKIILIGDKNQLSSVEPGNVFGDLCSFANSNNFIKSFYVELNKNYRFGEDSGIYKVSNIVNEKKVNELLEIIYENKTADIKFYNIPENFENFISFLDEKIEKYITEYINFSPNTYDEYLEKFKLLENFIILTDSKDGTLGKNRINFIIENLLKKKLKIKDLSWYDGKPLIITKNDINTKLYNGDVGFVDKDYFILKNGNEIRKIHKLRLPEYETAFSLTVHKSQGSEYNNVMIILGDENSKVLSKELLYTAITRARKYVEIWANRNTLIKCVSQEYKRESSLIEKLEKVLKL